MLVRTYTIFMPSILGKNLHKFLTLLKCPPYLIETFYTIWGWNSQHQVAAIKSPVLHGVGLVLVGSHHFDLNLPVQLSWQSECILGNSISLAYQPKSRDSDIQNRPAAIRNPLCPLSGRCRCSPASSTRTYSHIFLYIRIYIQREIGGGLGGFWKLGGRLGQCTWVAATFRRRNAFSSNMGLEAVLG